MASPQNGKENCCNGARECRTRECSYSSQRPRSEAIDAIDVHRRRTRDRGPHIHLNPPWCPQPHAHRTAHCTGNDRHPAWQAADTDVRNCRDITGALQLHVPDETHAATALHAAAGKRGVAVSS